MSTQEHKVDIKELRGHSNEELAALQKSLTEDLFKFRMQRYTNQLENTMQIRKLRRDIARVQTILAARAKGLEEKVEGGAAAQAAADEQPKAKKAKTTKKAPAKRTKKSSAEAQE